MDLHLDGLGIELAIRLFFFLHETVDLIQAESFIFLN